MPLPQITIIGNLVGDPELRFTPNGQAVARFRVACSSRRRTDNGGWEDGDTTFLSCQVWRSTAENVAESKGLIRGKSVIVVGQLKQREYETREGEKRTVYEVEASAVGPDLRFQIASIEAAQRNDPSTGGAGGFSSGSMSEGDPWDTGGAYGGSHRQS
jgi:single-strand DNA-binding protein